VIATSEGGAPSYLPVAMPLTIDSFAGPVLVTVGYVTLYYALLVRVLLVKQRLVRSHSARGEHFDRYFSADRELLAADRAALNLLEQMPPFLVLLWLHAVFVSAPGATLAGGIYLAARAAHPFLLGRSLGGMIRNRVLLSTVPAYLVITHLALSLAWAALN